MDSYVLRVKKSEYHKNIKKETFETFFCNFNCKRRFQINNCDVYIILVMSFVMSIQITYMDTINNCTVYILSYYHINSNPLSFKFKQ